MTTGMRSAVSTLVVQAPNGGERAAWHPSRKPS